MIRSATFHFYVNQRHYTQAVLDGNIELFYTMHDLSWWKSYNPLCHLHQTETSAWLFGRLSVTPNCSNPVLHQIVLCRNHSSRWTLLGPIFFLFLIFQVEVWTLFVFLLSFVSTFISTQNPVRHTTWKFRTRRAQQLLGTYRRCVGSHWAVERAGTSPRCPGAAWTARRPCPRRTATRTSRRAPPAGRWTTRTPAKRPVLVTTWSIQVTSGNVQTGIGK